MGERIERCDGCKHWEPNVYDDYGSTDKAIVHKCKKAVEFWTVTEWNDDYDRVTLPQYADQMMFVQDGSSYHATLLTKAEFFCAHWEKQE